MEHEEGTVQITLQRGAFEVNGQILRVYIKHTAHGDVLCILSDTKMHVLPMASNSIHIQAERF